jgi:hypothetical protein
MDRRADAARSVADLAGIGLVLQTRWLVS